MCRVLLSRATPGLLPPLAGKHLVLDEGPIGCGVGHTLANRSFATQRFSTSSSVCCALHKCMSIYPTALSP